MHRYNPAVEKLKGKKKIALEDTDNIKIDLE